jgi:hypothetical protein
LKDGIAGYFRQQICHQGNFFLLFVPSATDFCSWPFLDVAEEPTAILYYFRPGLETEYGKYIADFGLLNVD